jgi:hypothetical protein
MENVMLFRKGGPYRAGGGVTYSVGRANTPQQLKFMLAKGWRKDRDEALYGKVQRKTKTKKTQVPKEVAPKLELD